MLLLRTLTALALAAALTAQCPPGAPMPSDIGSQTTVADHSPAWNRWQSGKEALAAGNHAAARQHLQAALEFHPAAAPLLFDLVLACADDADLQQLWAERFVRAAVDAQGKLTLDAATRRTVAATAGLQTLIDQAQKLAALRAAAIADLTRQIERNKPSGQRNAARVLLVRWAADVARTLGESCPAALAAAAPAITKVQNAFAPDLDPILQSLQRVLMQRLPKVPGEPDELAATRALRAARMLAGMQQQGQFHGLQGPPPRDLGSLADAAEKLLAQRATEQAASGKVWTIDELAQHTPAEAAAFTTTHADWQHCAVASSATGRYRIETVCGHATLLEVARTIEFHHDRLAAHFGRDPFAQRQGVVRIVPEHYDLETEGAPHWWAAGFQSGDRTVVHFAWSNGPDLGRTLTHELTHRFDGVLRPFVGSWYGEGHAQWTAANYTKTADAACSDDTLDPFPPATTYYKGYGGREKFEQLLQGTIEDYRDNYPAGYSLYTFLRSWPLHEHKYRAALGRFEQNARAGQKNPVAWFTQCFCDGKDGRPASFEALLTEWDGFLRGCYEWNDDRKQGNEWVGEFPRPVRDEHGPMLMDPPTFSWSRVRAEPWFGQDHAAAATMLLAEVGDHAGTAAAGVWSLSVDGWRQETANALLGALRNLGPPEAAQAFAALATARFPALPPLPSPQLLDLSKPVRALSTALAARVEALRASAPHAAAATAAEHDQLARLLGQPPLAPAIALPLALARHLGSEGFTETSLTDYDELRQAGLWYATPDGDLHVGRERPRDGTGTLDREAHQRDAFVHSTAWQAPGDYVLRGRVHFTTSYVAGAIVFGHTRRDRDLRLHFEAGDQQYAIGKRDQDTSGGRLVVRLAGLWERDGQLPDTSPLDSFDLGPNQTWFDFVIHVRGPRVDVTIDGEPRFSYAVQDGAPIEGQVGFAMANGAVRVQAPTVQRRDGVDLLGLDLATACAPPLDELLLLPVRGVPIGTDGTIVLWLPAASDDGARPAGRLPLVMSVLGEMLRTPFDHPQSWVLAVPHDLSTAERDEALAAVRAGHDVPVAVIDQHGAAAFDGSFPWLLFVDGQGLLRAAAAANDAQVRTKVQRWARRLRHR